ncbi:phospholipase-like protein [Artemisia annua]|uniref:Phospholipase-like protein n=1 Tax=Artemisia annua TaxID=35608 RepID=A0A2U1L6D3_ARTAN|nr:phospholipase-like protein [Artemisia annua]
MAYLTRGNKLQFQLMDAGNKLFHLSSSTPDILNVLMQMEKVLSRVQPPPCQAMVEVLHPIIQALIAEKLVRHPDVIVNIYVVCCICEIIRIMAPNVPYNHEHMKEFFEVVVTMFEKQSSASGGYYGNMIKVLEILRKARLPVMMLDVQVEGLVGRLFKQFLTSADSNTSSTVLEMEKIMTMIIEEREEVGRDLEALIITTLDKIDSPVCRQLGGKVLMNCAAKLQPRLLDMDAKETIPSTSETSNLRNHTTHKIKVECLEESIDTVQTLRHCEHANTDRVNLQGHHTEDGKKTVSFDDPPMPSQSVAEVNGKRKRNNEQQRAPKKVMYNTMTRIIPQGVPRKVNRMTRVQGYKVKKINAPILEAIFKKHGDIASDCVVKTASVRESILEVVCEVVKRIQTNDIAIIISDMEEIEMQVLDAEATNMKVSWLRAHLEAIHKRNAAQKTSTSIVKMKANTTLVKRAAKMDLEERRIELLTAQEWFEKAEKCVKVLCLVEMKLNDNIVESEAEKDSWPEQPIL